MKQIRITVRRRGLMERYEPPVAHACDPHEGETSRCGGLHRPEEPSESVRPTRRPSVPTPARGGRTRGDGRMKNPAPAMISGNDGLRPVNFPTETIG